MDFSGIKSINYFGITPAPPPDNFTGPTSPPPPKHFFPPIKYFDITLPPPTLKQGWGQVQYLYLSKYLSVLDVLEYLVYGNAKVLVLVLEQKVLGTYK